MMWPRPLLNRRDRRWVTLACVGAMGAVVPIQTHLYAALNSGDCTLEELEEFTLFFATQCSWPRAQVVDQYLVEAAKKLGLESQGFEQWAEPRDPDAPLDHGRAAYEEIMRTPPPTPVTIFRRIGYFGYLYADIWSRPVLTRRERRIIAVCCGAIVDHEAEAQAHAALASRDLSFQELQEIVLHFAVYCGCPRGARLEDAVVAAAERADVIR